MKLVMIAACGKNRELGLHGDMPWKRALKEDLQFFREQTQSHPMLMGRKTFESLPGMLPGREHLVLTSAALKQQNHLRVYSTLDEFFDDWKDSEETIYVIGGGSLYAQLIDDCDELLLTEIESDFEADTWFPDFDPEKYERKVLYSVEENGYLYHHVRYAKKSSGLQK